MSKRRNVKISAKEDAISIGYLGLFGGFAAAYLGAEAVLAAGPHPVHWLVAGIGAVLVGGIAYGVTLWRRTRPRR
jgi:hypothetical protein